MSDNVSVAHQLSKRKADGNLILLHTILYGKKAQVLFKMFDHIFFHIWYVYFPCTHLSTMDV